MRLQHAELLLEGEVTRLAVTIHSGIIYDVGDVVAQDIGWAMGLQRLPAQVELPTAVWVAIHMEAIAHQELQVRRLRIIDAELVAGVHIGRRHETQSVLRNGRRPHAGDPVVIEEVRQRDKHCALACAFEGKAASLDDTERPAEVLEVDAPAAPRTGRDLVRGPLHALQVSEPIAYDVR